MYISFIVIYNILLMLGSKTNQKNTMLKRNEECQVMTIV